MMDGLGDCQAGKDCSVERGIFFVWVAPWLAGGTWDASDLAVCAATVTSPHLTNCMLLGYAGG